MASKDLKNNIKVAPSVVAQVLGVATATGTTVDTLGFEGATVTASVGALAVGTLEIHESDASGSGFAAAAAADCIGTQTVAVVQSDVVTIGYIGAKRYLRAVIALTTGDSITGDIILSTPDLSKTGANS